MKKTTHVQEPQLSDVMRFGDIHVSQLMPDVVTFLKENTEPVYRDQIMKENLFDINSTIEDIDCDNLDCPKVIYESLVAINLLLNKNDCAYLRIVYS